MGGLANLVLRGRVFYFRRRVPADFRERLGRRELVRSLGTIDPRAARSNACRLYFASEDLFTGLRAIPMLTDAELSRLVQDFYATVLQGDDAVRLVRAEPLPLHLVAAKRDFYGRVGCERHHGCLRTSTSSPPDGRDEAVLGRYPDPASDRLIRAMVPPRRKLEHSNINRKSLRTNRQSRWANGITRRTTTRETSLRRIHPQKINKYHKLFRIFQFFIRKHLRFTQKYERSRQRKPNPSEQGHRATMPLTGTSWVGPAAIVAAVMSPTRRLDPMRSGANSCICAHHDKLKLF